MNRQPYAESCLSDFIIQEQGLQLKRWQAVFFVFFFLLHFTNWVCAGFAFIWDKIYVSRIIFSSEIIFQDKTGTQFKKWKRALSRCVTVTKLNLLLPPAGYCNALWAFCHRLQDGAAFRLLRDAFSLKTYNELDNKSKYNQNPSAAKCDIQIIDAEFY